MTVGEIASGENTNGENGVAVTGGSTNGGSVNNGKSVMPGIGTITSSRRAMAFTIRQVIDTPTNLSCEHSHK